MWERTLQDLIRGIRANSSKPKAALDRFLDDAIDEIRKELKGSDLDLKSAAVVKMLYIMMLYPVPAPSPSFPFHIIETMSSPRFHIKQIGYLAASELFSPHTSPSLQYNQKQAIVEPEELLLTINGIRKDLLTTTGAGSSTVTVLALGNLSDFLTNSLAKSLEKDILTLLTHSKATVRKRAVLSMWRIWEKLDSNASAANAGEAEQGEEEGYRLEGWSRFVERLEDDDMGVVSACVNVLTELARKASSSSNSSLASSKAKHNQIQSILLLAPQLFDLLSKSTNNWLLIKVVKLFALLTPHEPRLIRKLLPPLASLITTTPAISLLYECVRTCITGGMLDDSEAGESLARVCVAKLSGFLDDSDQNLKYISLLSLVHIIPTHAHLIEDYLPQILASIDDPDLSLRMRALDLVCAMANRSNTMDIVDRLLGALVPKTTDGEAEEASAAEALLSAALTRTATTATKTTTANAQILLTPSYRLELSQRILKIGSKNIYESIPNFEWYLSVLIDLSYVSGVTTQSVSQEIKRQIVDILGRVKSVRRKGVELLSGVLDAAAGENGWNEGDGLGEVAWAAAWGCGEYCEYLYDPVVTIRSLLSIPSSTSPHTIAMHISSASKIFSYWATSLADRWDQESDLLTVQRVVNDLCSNLSRWKDSRDVDVQERTRTMLNLLEFLKADMISFKPPPKEDVGGYPEGAPSSTASRVDYTVSMVDEGTNAFASEARHTNDEGEESTSTAAVLSTPASLQRYPKSLFLLAPLFASYPLNPVSFLAQASIPIPEGLDLDVPLYDFSRDLAKDVELESEDEVEIQNFGEGSGGQKDLVWTPKNAEEARLVELVGGKAKGKKKSKKEGESDELSKEEKKKRKAARLAAQASNPYYVKSAEDDIDLPPMVKLSFDPTSSYSPLPSPPSVRPPTPPPVEIDRDGEMPSFAPSPSFPAMPVPAPFPMDRSANGSFSEVPEAASTPGTSDVEVVKVKKKKKKVAAESEPVDDRKGVNVTVVKKKKKKVVAGAV